MSEFLDLPIEIIELILRMIFIDVSDMKTFHLKVSQFYNLRLVNKKFNSIISNYRLKEIFFYKHHIADKKVRRFKRRPVLEVYDYYYNLRNQSFMDVLSGSSCNLNKLQILVIDKSITCNNLTIKAINSLICLKELYIDLFSDKGNAAFLKLERLRALYIDFLESRLVVEAPKLTIVLVKKNKQFLVKNDK